LTISALCDSILIFSKSARN